jgi:uncharacterized protein YegL
MALFQKPFPSAPADQKPVQVPLVPDPAANAVPSSKAKSDTTKIPDVGPGGAGPQWISERHVACVFLLDTSGSMEQNDAIGKLNAGLRAFKTQTMNNTSFDEHTKACIDVALVSFGPAVVVQRDFCPVSALDVPVLSANGGTPMGEALNKALDMITERKKRYSELGTPYYRPWIFCITDGEPNDQYQAAAQRLKQMEKDTKVLGFCVGVENFNRKAMVSIFDQERLFELMNLDFTSLFKFVSSSLAQTRNSDTSAAKSINVEVPPTLKSLNIPL